MKAKYTDEKNVQMLIYILKENNIKRIIASPGTTNISFVASVQNDDFFEVYSCVDERSACYMACGLAAETKEPVVLTCTGATASRNYIPGLTEAYYRKLPVLAVTAAQHFSRMGAYSPQCLDRTAILKDIANLSVQVPSVHSHDDEIGCNTLLNQAILELTHNGGGPVHINIETTSEGIKSFNTNKLPTTRIIERIEYNSNLPTMPKGAIGIFVGAHLKWNNRLTKAVDEFCEKYNACVICDHTSNYYGRYKILGNLLFDQDTPDMSLSSFELLIHLGSVSGAYMNIHPKTVWRVNQDGEFRDAFQKVTKVFQMDEVDFFNKYNALAKQKTSPSTYAALKTKLLELQSQTNDLNLPLSNLFVAQNTAKKIPSHSIVHLAILNSLRSWNFFEVANNDITFYCNTGGFGIDGPMSTLIGASLANPKQLCFGVIGDLAFFYDLNSLGNHNINNNLRIILINNGRGTEFHNYTHPASALGDEFTSQYISAGKHFGNKSSKLVKDYVEDLGFEYISASTKEEVLGKIDYFTANKEYNHPIVFEIFTNSQDESSALKAIRTLAFSLNGYITKNAKKILGQNAKNKIKKILGR